MPATNGKTYRKIGEKMLRIFASEKRIKFRVSEGNVRTATVLMKSAVCREGGLRGATDCFNRS